MKNYKFIEEKYLEEVAGNCKIYEHEKTGARVLTVENDDSNKTFAIAFRTTPEDSKGTAHIVEHCVLQGSRKYRTKEPFMDMLKSSMQTFLNAMTFPDKTVYPLSSRNEKDFYNLMDLYLDAVFYPRMYEEEKIFRQEGWHYELEDKKSELKRVGVVFNEMKGDYSSVDSQIYNALSLNLHPDSTYGVNSGGDPMEIPKLSYQEFLAFHKRYYHPSNSYIYLYGDMDMEKALEFIDKNYIGKFEKTNPDSGIKLNEPFKEKKSLIDYYSVDPGQEIENKDVLTYSVVVQDRTYKNIDFMMNFISELLITSDAGPIKLALQEKGLGEDIYFTTNSSLPYDFTIVAKNTSRDRMGEFADIIENTLAKIVKEGLDKKHVLSTLNKYEFSIREGSGPHKSIIYVLRALNSWLYDRSPYEGLIINEHIKEIREKLDHGYIEDFIKKYLIDNPYKVELTILPQEGREKQREDKQREDLLAYQKTLSEKELDQIIKETKELKAYQTSESSEEDKNNLPSLNLSDIDTEVAKIDPLVSEIKGAKYLFLEGAANKISYASLAFKIDHLREDELKDLALIDLFLNGLSTENYSFQDLEKEIYLRSGGISFALTAFQCKAKSKRKFIGKVKYLKGQGEKAFELIEEILTKTKFDDQKRIKDLLLEEKSALESSFMAMPNSFGFAVLEAQNTESGKFANMTVGSDYYDHIIKTLKDCDENFPALKERLEKVYGKILNKKDLIIHLLGEKDAEEEFKKVAQGLIERLSYQSENEISLSLNKKMNLGYTFSSNVNFVCQRGNFDSFGDYDGSMEVLKNFLSLDYLYTNIRAIGGAYGMGINFSREKIAKMNSFRDPKLKETLDVFESLPSYLSKVEISDQDLKNYIIGSMNTFNPLLDLASKADLSLGIYIKGQRESDLKKAKQEALKTDLEKIRSYSKLLEEILKTKTYCVIGGEAVKENKDLFCEVRNLIK